MPVDGGTQGLLNYFITKSWQSTAVRFAPLSHRYHYF
jgi:hypothetical protein